MRRDLKFLRTLLASFAASLVLIAAATAAQTQSSATQSFDIPAQSLASALQQFAASTNKEILFAPDLVRNRKAPSVSGKFTPEDALAQLLAESDLVFDETAPSVYVVRRKAQHSGAQTGEGGLRMVQVAQQRVARVQADADAQEALGPSSQGGAPGIITGRVTDETTGSALIGAIVRLTGTSLSAVSDARGEYRISAVPPGTYELSIDYLGSQADAVRVRVPSGQSVVQDFLLSNAVDTLVVRGDRSATAQALSQQRAAPNSTTVVAADLLGSFPAETASEALRRVPGVAFTRDDDTGEGSGITVRGFSSEAINIKLNGLDLQGSGFSRSVDLSGFLTENISQITIQKTLLPSHEATGSGGLVEIETRSGLDYGQRYFSFGLEQEWSSDAEFGDEPQGNVTAAWKLAPNFGVVGSVQYRETDRRNFDVVVIDVIPPVLPAGYTSSFLLPASFNFPFDPEFDEPLLTGGNFLQRQRDESNLTASLNFAWDIAEHTLLRLDLQQIRRKRDLSTARSTLSFLTTSVDMPVPELGGEVRRRTTLRGLRPTLGMTTSELETELSTVGLRGETAVGRWEFGYKVGMSRAHEESRNSSLSLTGSENANLMSILDPSTLVVNADDDAAGTLRVVDGGARLVGSNIAVLSLSQAGMDHVQSPSTYAIISASRSATDSPSEAHIGEFSARFNFASEIFSYIEAGMKYDAKERENLDDNFAASLAAVQSNESYLRISGRDTFLSDVRTDPFQMVDLALIGGSGHSVPFLRPGEAGAVFDQLDSLLVDDPATAYNEQRFNYTDRRNLDPILDSGAYLPNHTTEDRSAGYVESMVNFGNLGIVGGVRYERTKRETVAVSTPTYRDATSVTVPREVFVQAGLLNFTALSGDQETVTPSLLATYRQAENMVYRLGYFRSTVHPAFQLLTRSPQVIIDLRPAQYYGIIRESNPDLKPTKTDNLDLDVAYYFTRNPGLIRVAAFLKDVSSNFTSILLADGADNSVRQRILDMFAPLQAQDPTIVIPDDLNFMLNRPVNTEGGKIWGAEVEVIRQLDFLPGFWSDFSVLGNLTFTDGDVPTQVSARDDAGQLITLSLDRALEDQSKWSGTGSLGYERGGFSSRLIYTYQSESVSAFDEYNLNTVVPSYSTLDLRTSYTFERAGGRYALFLEGDNLLHGSSDGDIRSATASTFGEGSPDFFFPNTVQFSGGRTITLGMKATF